MVNIFKFFFFLFLFSFSSTFSFEIKWIVDGLNEPESVIYDKQSDAVYISNINGDPLKLDQNGYITKISVNGQIIEKKWISNLDAPKGLALYDNYLYVADINKIWKISIKNKNIKKFYVKDAGFLNDLVSNKNGDIYASDMFKNRIYRLKNNSISIWKQSKLLESPNGLLIEGNFLIVACWGKIIDGFKTSVKGKLIKVSLDSRQIKKFFSTRPIGNLDGIVFNKNNGYLVTDWVKGKLYTINKKGIVTKTRNLNFGSSDLEILMHKDLILVPMMKNNNIVAYQLN